MNMKELLRLCQSWDETPEQFAQIVSAFLTVSGTSQREMADEFEVAESTVSRWASGIARPHPRVRKLVVGDIRKRAQRATRPRDESPASSERPTQPSAPPLAGLAARSRS